MTETSPVASTSIEHDIIPGSSGSLLPGYKAKLIDAEGKVVTGRDQCGELLLQSPSVVLGYLHNERANAETFVHHTDGRWIRTGDEALIRRSPNGHEHIFITDRIKELIKVKVQKLCICYCLLEDTNQLTSIAHDHPGVSGRPCRTRGTYSHP